MTDDKNVTNQELKAILSLTIEKKSVVLAYVLWFFLGGLGIHRFYLGKTTSAVVMLLMTVIGWLTLFIGIGMVLLLIVVIWWIIDAVLIFIAARKTNKAIDNAMNTN